MHSRRMLSIKRFIQAFCPGDLCADTFSSMPMAFSWRWAACRGEAPPSSLRSKSGIQSGSGLHEDGVST